MNAKSLETLVVNGIQIEGQIKEHVCHCNAEQEELRLVQKQTAAKVGCL